LATHVGRTRDSVIDALRKRPQAFGFFQAVRILQRHFDLRAAADDEHRMPIGFDHPPAREIARLRAVASLAFPQSEVLSLELDPPPVEDEPPSPPQITVGFMGLIGPSGVLPTHYTQAVIDEAKSRRGTPTLDFFNLFNHRLISLFYRAWEKYRLPVNFENAHWSRQSASRRSGDAISECVYALVGMAPSGTRRRQLLPDEAFLFYSGHFFAQPRNATSLQRMLEELFAMPIRVHQFMGEWLQLSDDQMTTLSGGAGARGGANTRLGLDALAGSRVWNIEGLVRVRIGPVSYRQFLALMPGQRKLRQIAQFVRQYVGTTLETEYQIVLAKADVPQLRMPGVGDTSPGPSLGRNTWLLSGASAEDRDDAVIRYSGRIDCPA
jgi:type VI secretion system protein ImpH